MGVERVWRSGKRSTGRVVGSLSKRRSCQPVSRAHTRPSTVSSASASSRVSVSEVIRSRQRASVPGAGSGPWNRAVPSRTGKTTVRSERVAMIQ